MKKCDTLREKPAKVHDPVHMNAINNLTSMREKRKKARVKKRFNYMPDQFVGTIQPKARITRGK